MPAGACTEASDRVCPGPQGELQTSRPTPDTTDNSMSTHAFIGPSPEASPEVQPGAQGKLSAGTYRVSDSERRASHFMSRSQSRVVTRFPSTSRPRLLSKCATVADPEEDTTDRERRPFVKISNLNGVKLRCYRQINIPNIDTYSIIFIFSHLAEGCLTYFKNYCNLICYCSLYIIHFHGGDGGCITRRVWDNTRSFFNII